MCGEFVKNNFEIIICQNRARNQVIIAFSNFLIFKGDILERNPWRKELSQNSSFILNHVFK